MPDIFNRASIPIGVIPDIVYRESILGSFRMDTRYQTEEMTNDLKTLRFYEAAMQLFQIHATG
jgi:hypothetical protein